MEKANSPVSLADLSAAGIQLRPYEAATIVRELVLQASRGKIPGVPSSQVIRLSPAGVVSVEGPVGADGPSVARAAQLLESLLPVSEATGHTKIPGGLRLIVARAVGALDLPPFLSLDAFAEALARFAAKDPASTVSSLALTCIDGMTARRLALPAPTVESRPPVATVEPFVAPRMAETTRTRNDLTVSDIRRARRATGLPLAQVAKRSRIPLALLRQLEWGYLLNWPSGRYGRTQLIRYARAAGLDEQLVVATITPLLREAESRRRALVPSAAPAPSMSVPAVNPDPVVEVEILRIPEILDGGTRKGRARLVVAAAAMTAVLCLLLVPTYRSNWGTSEGERIPAAVERPGPAPSSAVSADARANAVVATPAETDTPAALRTSRRTANAPQPQPAAYKLAADGVTYSPSFGAAETAMFFHANGEEGSALVRADTDGNGAVLKVTRIVDDTAKNYHIRPSPDGSMIAFDSDRDGERGVYVANGDGTNVRRVSPGGYSAVPSWSPDGKNLAFIRAEPWNEKVWNLWTLELATGTLRQITNRRYGQPWGGSWFPDGRRIAYSHERRLIIHDLETGDERVFRSPRPALLRTPAVSPDGKRIVFQVARNGTWLLELSDESMRRVLEDPTAEEYTWSPDGRQIAYHSQKAGGWGVWVMTRR